MTACGLDHQGESVLGLGRRDRPTADPDRDLAGQALAGDPRPARGDGHGEEIRERSGMPLDPYFSAGKLAWLLEHDTTVQRRARRGHAPDRHRRLVPVRPARSRVRHRPLDRIADAARRRPTGTRRCSNCSACPRRAAGDRGHRWAISARFAIASWRPELAAAGALRRSAGGPRRSRTACGRASSRRRTGPACSCSPTPATSARTPPGGLLPTVAWQRRRPRRVGDRRRRVHRRGAARLAEP